MTIETKYNIRDHVWVIYRDKAQKGSINCIHAHDDGFKYNNYIEYRVHFGLGITSIYKEYQIFTTKEELIASL